MMCKNINIDTNDEDGTNLTSKVMVKKKKKKNKHQKKKKKKTTADNFLS